MKSYKEYPDVLFDVLDKVEEKDKAVVELLTNQVMARRREFYRFTRALALAAEDGDDFAATYYVTAKDVVTTTAKVDDDTTRITFTRNSMTVTSDDD